MESHNPFMFQTTSDYLGIKKKSLISAPRFHVGVQDALGDLGALLPEGQVAQQMQTRFLAPTASETSIVSKCLMLSGRNCH